MKFLIYGKTKKCSKTPTSNGMMVFYWTIGIVGDDIGKTIVPSKHIRNYQNIS
jgi:hypothetical protein